MEIYEYLRVNNGDEWSVTYKYWKTGECACSAIKIKRTFDKEPTKQDLIQAI